MTEIARRENLFIGTMSGTSMDGIDIVLASISNSQFKTIASYSEDFPDSFKNRLSALCTPGDDEIERCGRLDIEFGLFTATAINTLLKRERLKPEDIKAIGSHGQTIRHRPDANHAFSWQIGNPSTIADQTGITTIADFRMADMAAGGQGAPLVPAFHQAVFASHDQQRVIVNIGGISNITVLCPDNKPHITGYDTGPGNTLLDQWIQENKQENYDKNGNWGRSGTLIPELLNQMKQDPYIEKKPPKSTGREHFNLSWIQSLLMRLAHENSYTAEDIQHTLTEFTAQTIAQDIKANCSNCDIFLCGGGINNQFLMERLNILLPTHPIKTTASIGIDPQQVEAAAFAWLASQTLAGLPGNIPEVTGARKAKVLGGIYTAHPN